MILGRREEGRRGIEGGLKGEINEKLILLFIIEIKCK